MKSRFLVIVALFLLNPANASADRANPAVKINLEVVVFEDGKVDVIQRRNMKKASRSTNKSGCGCPATWCKDCKSGKDGSRCKNCPLCPVGSQSSPRQKAAKFQGNKMSKNINVARITQSMMALDRNDDGRLNADEIAPRLKSPFSQVDQNGDGYLDAGEVRRQVRKKMQKK